MYARSTWYDSGYKSTWLLAHGVICGPVDDEDEEEEEVHRPGQAYCVSMYSCQPHTSGTYSTNTITALVALEHANSTLKYC